MTLTHSRSLVIFGGPHRSSHSPQSYYGGRTHRTCPGRVFEACHSTQTCSSSVHPLRSQLGRLHVYWYLRELERRDKEGCWSLGQNRSGWGLPSLCLTSAGLSSSLGSCCGTCSPSHLPRSCRVLHCCPNPPPRERNPSPSTPVDWVFEYTIISSSDSECTQSITFTLMHEQTD